jgi:hypothetical protein
VNGCINNAALNKSETERFGAFKEAVANNQFLR